MNDNRLQGNRLQGKVAIVTGAGTRGPMPGTGQATAILFARQGAKVLLVDLELDRAQQTQAAIEAEGGQASVFLANMTQEDQCKAMVETCVERYGALHILFNNVGVAGSGKVTEVEESDWARALDGNLKTAVLASKYAVPAMVEAGGGSVINVSSIDGLRAGMRPNIPYAVAKGGLVTLTKAMAVHHGRDGVRTNCIAPSHLHAPFVAHIPKEKRELRRKAGPLGTEGDGIHYCLGAPLARLELAIFLEEFTRRMPSLRLAAEQDYQYSPNTSHRGLRTLWCEWDKE